MFYPQLKIGLFIFFLGTRIFASEEVSRDELKLREEMKMYSLNRGYRFAEEIINESELFDLESVIEGIRQCLRGEPLQENASNILNEKNLRTYEKQLFEIKSQKNLEKAELYFSTILDQKKAIHILEKGTLFYEIIETGHGSLSLADQDTVLATFTLFDTAGKEIFSSQEMKDNSVITFSLNELLPSIARAMVGMFPGEKRKIYVHPNLAYGKLGFLPPNSPLIIEVKLIEIVHKTAM